MLNQIISDDTATALVAAASYGQSHHIRIFCEVMHVTGGRHIFKQKKENKVAG